MGRDITKSLDNYKQWISKQKSTKGAIYYSDAQQLIELSTTDGKCYGHELALNAIQAGFWIGYCAGKREAAKRAKA